MSQAGHAFDSKKIGAGQERLLNWYVNVDETSDVATQCRRVKLVSNSGCFTVL